MKNFSNPYTALVLSLLVTAFSFSSQAQNFQKAYDLGSDDYINMSRITATGDVVSVGSSSYAGAGGYDAILTKTDANGTLLWQKQYGGTGTEFGTAVDITTSKSGYIIAGRTNSGTAGGRLDVLLIKTDNDGNVIWSHSYGTDSVDYAVSVKATSDNGYIVTGQTNGLANRQLDLLLLKVDSAGTVEWFNAYGSQGRESGFHVVEDPSDSGYVALGYSGLGGSGYNDVYLVKTDAAGAFEGQVLLGGTGDDTGRRILLADSNRALITGLTRHQPMNSQDEVFAIMVDFNNFSVMWSKTYGNSAGNDAPTNVAELPAAFGGGYAFSVNTSSFGGEKGMIFSVSNTGGLQGGLVYGGASAGNVYFQDLQFTSLGNAVITGYGNVFGGASNDLYLIGFAGDPNQLTCLKQEANLAEANLTVNLLGGPSPINTHTPVAITASAVVRTLTTVSATVSDTSVCANLPLIANAGNDKSFCPGGNSVQIGANPAAEGGTGPYTYAWTPAAGLDNVASSNPNASPTTQTTYVLTVTDSLGATAVDSVVVSIAAPAASINPPGPNICFGQNVTLTASGGVSYVWSTGETTAQIVKNPTQTSTTYTVTVTDANGCTASDSEVVTMHDFPNVSVASSNVSVCPGDSVQLSATGANTFVWTPATGLDDDSIATPLAFPTATTTYTVTGRIAHCVGQNATATVTVTVESTAPTVTVTPASATICDTSSTGVQLTASGAQTYTWTPTAGLSAPNVANPTATPATTTTYTVTGSNNCGTASPVSVTVTVDVCIGIFDIPQSVANVFPNPATDNVNVTFSASSASTGVLSVLGVDGKTELEMNIGIASGVNNVSIDTKALPTGLYFVKITSANVNAIGKVVIE